MNPLFIADEKLRLWYSGLKRCRKVKPLIEKVTEGKLTKVAIANHKTTSTCDERDLNRQMVAAYVKGFKDGQKGVKEEADKNLAVLRQRYKSLLM